MVDRQRTTIELTKEHRLFLDSLPHGHVKLVFSALLDCAVELSVKYGARRASSFIQGGIMQLTDRPKGGD